MAIQLNESNFESFINNDPKVMVEFFATWCPHCQRMQPIVDELADELTVPVYQVDVDKNPDLAAEYAPQGFPTFILFENGQMAVGIEGEQSKEALIHFIENN